jgi:hypothetical protein
VGDRADVVGEWGVGYVLSFVMGSRKCTYTKRITENVTPVTVRDR